jgi:hypothetical protein
MTTEAARGLLDEVATEFLHRPGVDWGPMFSRQGLRVRGKVFAVASHSGELMVKLPELRIDELVAEGSATRMVMRDRPMREWAVIPLTAGYERWLAVVRAAYEYLDEITPR